MTPLPAYCHFKCYADKGVRYLNSDARKARRTEFGVSKREMDAVAEEVKTIQLHRAESMKEDHDRTHFSNLGKRLFRVIETSNFDQDL